MWHLQRRMNTRLTQEVKTISKYEYCINFRYRFIYYRNNEKFSSMNQFLFSIPIFVQLFPVTKYNLISVDIIIDQHIQTKNWVQTTHHRKYVNTKFHIRIGYFLISSWKYIVVKILGYWVLFRCVILYVHGDICVGPLCHPKYTWHIIEWAETVKALILKSPRVKMRIISKKRTLCTTKANTIIFSPIALQSISVKAFALSGDLVLIAKRSLLDDVILRFEM